MALAGLQCGRRRHFYGRGNAAGLAYEKKVRAIKDFVGFNRACPGLDPGDLQD
ncbi:hypothetical protein SBDP1_850022 [Syntrophobacter sp. SbD1]|nr:hypothetical protein SBDP1_850022 [Syntrophobacter sp. SbD1]